MRESAMMREAENRAFDEAYDIEIGGPGSQGHGHCRESRFAIESGAGEDGAGEEMCEWFQGNFVT